MITVVVDATFGHRIDKKEVAEFDEAVAHNELVAPPAGAIGRGDAFVLSIANKVGARILTNDSFQEFHGDYPWLFDEGRLIGGKPVPHVGWVFVERLPVQGPGRAARPQRAARRAAATPRPGPPARRARRPASRCPCRRRRRPARRRPEPPADRPQQPRRPRRRRGAERRRRASGRSPVNDLLPFLDFVEHHPVGSSVNGVVESYSSHGAYVSIGDVRGYVPLRLMGEPPPRSAREVMQLGDAVTLVVDELRPGPAQHRPRRPADGADTPRSSRRPSWSSWPRPSTAGRSAAARKQRRPRRRSEAPAAPRSGRPSATAAPVEAGGRRRRRRAGRSEPVEPPRAGSRRPKAPAQGGGDRRPRRRRRRRPGGGARRRRRRRGEEGRPTKKAAAKKSGRRRNDGARQEGGARGRRRPSS